MRDNLRRLAASCRAIAAVSVAVALLAAACGDAPSPSDRGSTPRPSVGAATPFSTSAATIPAALETLIKAGGLDPAALVSTGDRWFLPRRTAGNLELLLVSEQSTGWQFTKLAAVVDSAPADAAYSSLYVVSCPGLSRNFSTYVFGALTDGVDSNLRLDGAEGVGGAIVDHLWAFGVSSGGKAIRIFGKLPAPRYELSGLDPTTACLNEPVAIPASP